MPDPEPPQISILDARLAEIDQRLRTIQTGLAPVAEPVAPPTAEPLAPPSSAVPVALTAGPFASTEAVRAFQQAVAGLPGVHHVELRGYEGADRAVLEVHLAPPTS